MKLRAGYFAVVMIAVIVCIGIFFAGLYQLTKVFPFVFSDQIATFILLTVVFGCGIILVARLLCESYLFEKALVLRQEELLVGSVYCISPTKSSFHCSNGLVLKLSPGRISGKIFVYEGKEMTYFIHTHQLVGSEKLVRLNKDGVVVSILHSS